MYIGSLEEKLLHMVKILYIIFLTHNYYHRTVCSNLLTVATSTLPSRNKTEVTSAASSDNVYQGPHPVNKWL